MTYVQVRFFFFLDVWTQITAVLVFLMKVIVQLNVSYEIIMVLPFTASLNCCQYIKRINPSYSAAQKITRGTIGVHISLLASNYR